jgi:hypothetical protein
VFPPSISTVLPEGVSIYCDAPWPTSINVTVIVPDIGAASGFSLPAAVEFPCGVVGGDAVRAVGVGVC